MTKAQHDQKLDKLKKDYVNGYLTLAEYEKAVAQIDFELEKSEKYQDYKAGKITNYAYIQWKKQNDPSKQAPGGPVSASAKKGGTSAGATQKAASGATGGSSAATLTGMTPEQKANLLDYINQFATDGTIDYDDANELSNMLNDLQANGISSTLAKDAITNAVDLMDANGMSATEAAMMAQADVYVKAQAASAATAATATQNPGQAATDAETEKLEKRLAKVYKEAEKELKAKLAQMQTEYGEKYNKKLQDLQAGKITQAEFDAWAENQVATLDTWKKKIEQCSGVLLNANQKAMAMVNGGTVNVFAENANWQSFQITQDVGMNISFAIYDERTVERLIKERPELLPRKVVNEKKDKAWNKTKIANAVTQAIIQGESIPELASRIAKDTASDNGDAMIRYARTAMTGAQNAGRMETLHQATGMGIKVRKRWLAILDSRTRDSHQHMDGVSAEVDEKFPNGLMYPGDPAGAPREVYNCRCTLVYDYEGYSQDPTNNQRIQYDDYYTTYKDKEGKIHKVYHRTGSSLINYMNYPEWKAAKQGSVLNDLSIAKGSLAQAQKAFIMAKVDESKVYAGLWKDDVTLADYPAKKAGIQAKRDYYTAEINKLNTAIANGESWATPEKVKELVKKRTLLNEFEKKGELLEKRNAALKAVQDLYDKVGYQQIAVVPVISMPKAAKKAGAASAGAAAGTAGKSLSAAAGTVAGQFAPDAWDDKTRAAAARYRSREVADKHLRAELDEEWDNLTEAQKYACWEYTHNSNPMNKSLSGYHDKWDRNYFIGYDKTDWGHEDPWRSIPSKFKKYGKDGKISYHKAITDLTNCIEKTVFKEDRWLVRGSDNGGFAGMLEGAGLDFKKMKALLDSGNLEKIKKTLVGQKAKNHAFTSTGIASDAGFSGEVKFSIYAPKGTRGIYAEPQSYYGDTIFMNAKFYKKGESYFSVGHEAEVILQRGTTFVIRNIKKNGSGIEVEMDIVEQPDYFRNGDEDTYNDGKTRHKR